MDGHLDSLGECPDCGLLQHLPAGPDGARLTCERCDAVLEQTRRFSILFCASCAGGGFLLLLLAWLMPLASVSFSMGRYVETDLEGGLLQLHRTGALELSVIVALTLLVFPLLKFSAVLAMAFGALRGYAPRIVRRAFVYLPWLRNWAMIDVFLLGAMIALLRLEVWGHLGFEPALVALAGVAVCSLGIDGFLDRRTFWRKLHVAPSQDPTVPPIGCRHCGGVVRVESGAPCPRCCLKVESRREGSIGSTWAFVIAGALLLIPANFLPVMTITKLGQGGPSTIMGGVLELIERDLIGLAILVFVASLVIPLFKLIALAILLLTTANGAVSALPARTKLHRFVVLIGRWSMLDIFATMTLVALARLGWLGSVVPGLGATAFCAVVIATMIAAERFDSRLMWDAAGKNPRLSATGPAPFDTGGVLA